MLPRKSNKYYVLYNLLLTQLFKWLLFVYKCWATEY